VIGVLVRCYQQARSPEGGSLGTADLDGELAANGGVAAGQQSEHYHGRGCLLDRHDLPPSGCARVRNNVKLSINAFTRK
jgi:hypothetical protein